MSRRFRCDALVLAVVIAACGGGQSSSPSDSAVSSVTQEVTGQDGTLAVTTANTVVNEYAVLGANVAVGSTTVTVTDIADFATGLAAGDLIMLYQTAGATINTSDTASYGNVTLGGAGNYELVHVTNVVGNTITIENSCGGLARAYTTAGKTQVIKVPQAATLSISGAGSITAKPWDGATGGVVAVHVQSTASIGGGGIDVSGDGFRGGAVSASSAVVGSSAFRSTLLVTGAEKGESIAGDQTTYDGLNGRFGRGAPANGGGGGDAVFAPGGGGANGNNGNTYTGAGVMDNTVTGGGAGQAWDLDPEFVGNALANSSGGGRGGYSLSTANQDALTVAPGDPTWGGNNREQVGGRGGHPLTANPANRLFLGGGGGAGATGANDGGAGGRGGGLVVLVANSVSGTGDIKANGSVGADSTGDGPGGGGGGGTIVIKAQTIANTLTLQADGGDGGDQGASAAGATGGGGGGGGGFIGVSTGTPTRTAAGGVGGITGDSTLSEFPTNGATKGATGQATQTVTTVAVCTGDDLSITKTNGVTSSTPGTQTTYTITATHTGAEIVNTTVNDTFPAALSGVTWTCVASAGSTCPASGNGNIGNVSVTLAPTNGTVTFTATGTIGAGQTADLVNTATIATPAGVTDPNATNNSATDTDTLTPSADLSIAITDSPDPVLGGANLVYTIAVANAGPSTATSLVMTDTLPAGVGFVSATGTNWSCSQAAGVVTCTRASQATGAGNNITITVTAPLTSGTITNTATIAAASTDPDNTDNTDSEDTTVNANADLSVSITDSPDPVNAAGTLTYTVTVANAGPATASSLTMTDTLPAGVTFVSATGTGWTCTQAAGVVTCTRATLAITTAPAITITVTAPSEGGTITNTATIDATNPDPDATDDSDSETTTVTARADLAVTQTDNPDPVIANGTLTYTVSVTNNGPSTAQSVTLTDTLPATATFVSVNGGATWSCSQAAGVVTCTRATLAPGAAPNITIVVTAPAQGGTITNTAAIATTTTDPVAANNSDSETTTVTASADLAISQTDNPDPVTASSSLQYIVTVTNNGPSNAATLTMTDTLPAGVTFVSATGTGWTCSQAAGVVTCTRAALNTGVTAPAITITVTAPANGTTLTNTAAIAAATGDPNNTNNSSTETTTVTSSANLSITKIDTPDPVTAGANLTYTLTVANAGPSTADTLTMTDTLPPGVTFVSATGTGWVCSQAAGIVTCTRATLAVTTAPAITIVVTAPSEATSLSNTAVVSSNTADPNNANNTATATTTVNASANLSITLADNPDPVATGAQLVYTVSVTNAGPSTAANVSVVTTLPAGVTFVDAAGTGWTCNEANLVVTCTRATLAPGAAPDITITVTSPLAVGTITCTTTVTSATPDPANGNNSDSETTSVTPSTNLAITITDSPDPVEAGKPLVYTIIVSNGGPIVADNVRVTDTLAAGTVFVSGTGTGWSCTPVAQVVTCNLASLAVNASSTLTLTVTPTQLDGTTLTNSVSVASDASDPLVADNTASVDTLIIDREIEVTAIAAFPDTFRNPGMDGPVRPITVRNDGMATLHVTSITLTTTDVFAWSIVDTTPQDIPPGASFDYLLRFTPEVIGQVPDAIVTIASDDRDEPTVTQTFSGAGIDRLVRFADAPARIDLGFTGIGVDTTIDGALLIQNMNATADFAVAGIELVDAEPGCLTDADMTSNAAAFEIVDPPIGADLPHGAELSFDVTLRSATPGRFVASARLMVRPDPVPQDTICVEGQAVFVDAHGGGGCSTTGGSSGGALLVLGAVVLGLRRRRAAIAAAAATLGIAQTASADKLALSIFDPTPATEGSHLQLQSAEVGPNGTWVISAIVSHATDPLVLDASEFGQAQVLQRSTQLSIGGAYAFLDRFEAGAHVPIFVQDGATAGNSQMMFASDPVSGTAMGDLTMHGKVRLWKRAKGRAGGRGELGSSADAGAALGAAMQLTLPTSKDDSFTGTEKPSLRVLGLATLVPDTLEHRITLSGHAGAIARAKTQVANIEQGSGGTFGLGLSVRALDRTWLAAEVYGDVLPAARKATATSSAVSLSPIEWLGGIRWLPDHRFAVSIAAGRGLTSAAGSPALRGVLSLTYTPGAPDLVPIKPPVVEKPDGDADGDGIADRQDKCPNEAEDKDLFDDSDGCPELDNDADGVADTADKCALDAEDKDGFEDGDGCPDKDDDNDGVPDKTDKCRLEPEDKDGHEDLDGCPDNDNDHDGVDDGKDKCPNEPETINGNKDDDGCPDAGDSSIVLSPDRIETLDAVVFERNAPAKISKASNNLLGQVAATMRAHPEIIRMRVTVHVNPSKDFEKDQELSDKRAQAIRDWLIQYGLTGARVEARGFGSSKPLDKNGNLNDRVEFIILERK